MSRNRATIIGFFAVVLWALLALFTVASAPTPPFLLNTICFSIGGVLGLLWAVANGVLGTLRHVPLKIYGLGTLGLFGYHALYFSALRMAPPAQAGLIAYLWPLLIVVFSGLLPGERLGRGHLIGAVIGFSGAALIILGDGAGFSAQHMTGYMLALLCALFWSAYSVISRAWAAIPTASVAVFCLGSAVLSLPLHLILEETALPEDLRGWAAIAGLGLGPVGLAFFLWDIGVKRGDIQLLGTSSYAAPLLSTLVLVLAGVAAPSITLLWAAVLITGGALAAARASVRMR